MPAEDKVNTVRPQTNLCLSTTLLNSHALSNSETLHAKSQSNLAPNLPAREHIIAQILNLIVAKRVNLVLKAIENSKSRTVDYFMSMWSNGDHSGVLDLGSNSPFFLSHNIKGSFVEDTSPKANCILDWGVIPTL